jgi:hypothetical protein
MLTAASGSLSGNQISSYHENRASRKTDLTFYSKGQLKQHIESLESEAFYRQKKYDETIEMLGSEIKRLLDQRLKDQETILEKSKEIGVQRDKIIDLYSKLMEKENISPLKVAG